MSIPTLDEIFDEFLDLDPVDQNQYLMELGYELPPFPEEARTESNRVHGCQSQVWLTMNASGAGNDATFTIVADSDANIIKGLLAILESAYNGKTAKQIAEFDILGVFKKLDLEHHITPQRRNGLRGMVERILQLANRHQLVAGCGELADAGANIDRGCGLSIARDAATAVRSPLTLSNHASPDQPFDAAAIRAQFPVLNRALPSGRFPVYLDSGASAQKPSAVIEKEREVEEQY
ncbi:MAG: SufE family protein, partial [Planctomycetota bacterium]